MGAALLHRDPSAALPAVIIGGYLGAGKTTLVNHLLRTADGRRIAVLVNDFGDISIDADLIEGADGEVLSLAGGCVCCSFGSDLIGAVMALRQRQPPPDVLLIETSGVGLPAAVARSVRLVPGVAVDGIVVICDAETLRERAADRYVGSTVIEQLQQADLLLLNKCDLITDGARLALRQWLSAQTQAVSVLETSQARVPADVVLGLQGQQPQVALQGQTDGGGLFTAALRGQKTGICAPATSEAVATQAADTRFEAERLLFCGPQDIEALTQMLTAADSRVVRAKGWLMNLQGQRVTLQVVGRRVQVTPCTVRWADDRSDQVVVIRTK